MSAKVIQGWFLGGQPKPTALVPPKLIAPLPIQTKTVTRPPGPPALAFARRLAPPIQTKTATRPPGPPAPAFAGRVATVQRRAAGGAFAVEAGRLGLTTGGGKPLPEVVRGKMEAALRADFANVRVHVGPQAERIGAIAFTTGNDIYFAPGRYQPNTLQGQQLLGHELAHVVQQRAGRVRNPLGAGLAVVLDRALEEEAERVGRLAVTQGSGQFVQRAALRPGPPPRTVPRSWDIQHQVFQQTGAIQRTIWQFKNGKWFKQGLGTKGLYARPKKSTMNEGEYFNDINNKRGSSKRAVSAGLTDLMMITGSAVPKNQTAAAWEGKDVLITLKEHVISGRRAQKRAAQKAKGVPETGKLTAKEKNATSFIELGKIQISRDDKSSTNKVQYFKNNGDRDHDNESFVKYAWEKLLEPLMKRNGQLAYIYGQEWYMNGLYAALIDVNYYYNRELSAQLGFHKDTDGQNLFVNLIFDNETKMLGTEWVADTERGGKDAAKYKKRLMPTKMRAEIKASREAIAGGTHRVAGVNQVEGGTTDNQYAFVSWVDELLWHATPYPGKRADYTIGTERGQDIVKTGEEVAKASPDKWRGLATTSQKVPTGIENRPRANSDAKQQADLLAAAAGYKYRSFIRTWVRIAYPI